MRTKTFISTLENNGYKVQVNGSEFEISLDGWTVASISKKTTYEFSTIYTNYRMLREEDKESLYSVLDEYARTSISDRSDEVYYKIEIKTTDSTFILWKATDGSDDTDFINKNRITTGQMKFTQNEIEEIDPRLMIFADEVDVY